jgi:hypothetical protein
MYYYLILLLELVLEVSGTLYLSVLELFGINGTSDWPLQEHNYTFKTFNTLKISFQHCLFSLEVFIELSDNCSRLI